MAMEKEDKTPEEELKETLEKIVKKKNLIAEMEEEEDIIQEYNDKKEELGELRAQATTLTKQIAESVENWKPDTFSQGKKDVFRRGGVAIYRTVIERREIIAALFTEKFPLHVALLMKNNKIKIPLNAVEQTAKNREGIPKEELEEVVERKTQVSYEAELTTLKDTDTAEKKVKTGKKGNKKKEKATA